MMGQVVAREGKRCLLALPLSPLVILKKYVGPKLLGIWPGHSPGIIDG